jgi:hypothetical protein
MPRPKLYRLIAVSAAAALAASLGACEPLGPDELKREVDSIHSAAAEGSVLADEVGQQETKRNFARVQARELSDGAEHSAERLTDAQPADGLNEATSRAIHLADQISAAIGQIERAPDDASAAAAAAQHLRRLADRTDALAESL